MLRSMTAYGRATLASPLGHFVLELSSVNRRYLEIICNCPPEFLCFEGDFRKWIGEALSRGAISVKLTVEFAQSSIVTLRPNLVLARQFKDAWDQISSDLELPHDRGFNLEMLKDVDQIILQETNQKIETELQSILRQLFLQGLEKLLIMKETEGTILWEDISQRLDSIHPALHEIEILAPETVKRLQCKLQDKLEELLPGHIENEERILREICVFAEKADISEEIARLRSHLKQFVDLIDALDVRVGKTLDFLLQEMNREINTIGSKCSELKISQQVVFVKNELERIREQIQNVE